MKHGFGIVVLFGIVFLTFSLVLDTDEWGANTKKKLNNLLYEKELRYSGLHSLQPIDVEALLPLEKSVLWWFFRSEEIAEHMQQNPRIESAWIDSCRGFLSRCFAITIREQQALFVAFIGDKAWKVSSEGVFIELVDSEFDLFDREATLALVKNLVTPGLSPDIVRARLVYVGSALGIIEKESGLRVREIEVQDNGEIEIRFLKHAFTVIFDSDEPELEVIRQESRRLKQLLAELDGQEQAIDSVDLALDRMAVVRIRKLPPNSQN